MTTVEVDAAVAAAARESLRRAGLGPTVVTGDGYGGHLPGAPYDRVIATCGMREIPYAWVEQTAPGGIVVAPWGTRYGNGDAVARLVVEDGVASGRFTRLVRRAAVRHGDYVSQEGADGADASTTTVTEAEFHTGRYTQYGPRRLWDEVEAAFRWWTGRGKPGVERFGLTVDAGGQYVWLDDPAASWGI
ncbi:hypothetical protein [Streptomyces sp. CBMA29]|uniref:hypothetical protein n=1 Tax=Streptomyces sp. CBMA29 TaxID=1896314 RepID=UPI002948BB4B|nr:hypothetical protein [Streptomyces sp. CBMA29]MBD0738612.1 hypothetical protein [Streptomyces sp. CBMA29]